MTKEQSKKLKDFFFSSRGVLHSFFRLCDSKLTIMIVPHSNARVVNLQTNILAFVLAIILALGVLVSCIFINKKNIADSVQIGQLTLENQEAMASFDELRDENNNLLESAKKFREVLSKSLSLVGIDYIQETKGSPTENSDLSSIFSTENIAEGSTQETRDIKELTTYLDSAVAPVEQIGKMLESQGTLFSDVPNIWPLRGGVGHISMPFGQNVHPITGQWYIHKGIDFSMWRCGDPIVATANGQIVTVTYAPDFGHYVIIKHKYGIYTRYAHMQTVRVHKGQFVSQGQTIGTVGNSGITTGPHLHYEVHIGSEVVDPAKYINVKVQK